MVAGPTAPHPLQNKKIVMGKITTVTVLSMRTSQELVQVLVVAGQRPVKTEPGKVVMHHSRDSSFVMVGMMTVMVRSTKVVAVVLARRAHVETMLVRVKLVHNVVSMVVGKLPVMVQCSLQAKTATDKTMTVMVKQTKT
tara:strand:+ start:5452 stop:5868 length:417 start_codon:yes stop_codon:yes gene_type:complete